MENINVIVFLIKGFNFYLLLFLVIKMIIIYNEKKRIFVFFFSLEK